MTDMESPANHHEAAVTHHLQAAHFHREASRHFKIGKDYAHAAHLALAAHDQALHAQEHGQSASAYYAAHGPSPFPCDITRSAIAPVSAAMASGKDLGAVAHHILAAEHHEEAARIHVLAELHGSTDHYVRTLHQTQTALGHGTRALFHDDQASMHHMEHYGSHPPSDLA